MENNISKGKLVRVCGDSADLRIEDYNVRVDTVAEILEQPNENARDVYVRLFSIDGDNDVCTFVARHGLQSIETEKKPMKIYARQVAPELQISPLMEDGFFPDGIILNGNSDFKTHITREYKQIQECFDDMAQEWEDSHGSATISELLQDYGFRKPGRPGGKPWSSKEKHEWRLLFESGKGAGDEEVDLTALRLLTGSEWEEMTIRGCLQREWHSGYYRMDMWSDSDLLAFESEYFNTGTEWVIHTDNEEPKTPEDIQGSHMYVPDTDIDGVRKAIADDFGVNPEDVVLYVYTGYTKVDKYEIA